MHKALFIRRTYSSQKPFTAKDFKANYADETEVAQALKSVRRALSQTVAFTLPAFSWGTSWSSGYFGRKTV